MQLGMPPRASLTGSFSVSDDNNVVVCPLRNHDGSACRKRCTGVSVPLPVSSRLVCPPTSQLSLRHHDRPQHQYQTADTMRCTGKAVSLHAGAYPSRPSRALHLQAPCHRRELHADDQYPSLRTTSSTAPPKHFRRPTRLVPKSLQHQQRRLTRSRLWGRSQRLL
jgi:hypothetical protein